MGLNIMIFNWLSSFFTSSQDSLLLNVYYDPLLVAISIFIAIFSAFMAFQVATQAGGRVVNAFYWHAGL